MKSCPRQDMNESVSLHLIHGKEQLKENARLKVSHSQ